MKKEVHSLSLLADTILFTYNKLYEIVQFLKL